MSKGRIVAGIVIVLALGGAVAAFALNQTSGIEVRAEKAERDSLVVSVSASGVVERDDRADVYPPSAGTLASVNVTDGQEVAAGDVLAVMDTEPLELAVAQAEAAYRAALAQSAAIAQTTPSAADKRAADAAVNAAYAAYEAAAAQYDAAKSAVPSSAAIEAAEQQVADAKALYDQAEQAYSDFAAANPAPRDAASEAALAALGLLRDQAYANHLSAQAQLTQLQAAADNTAAVAAAQAAKDQAWAGYLAAVAQQAGLARASDTGAAQGSASAAVASAERALAFAQENLEAAELRAPIDGVVLFNDASSAGLGTSALGGLASTGGIAEGSSVSPAAAPFTVVAFDELVFTAQVDEADIARLEPGMRAVVVLDALSGTEFETTVESIGKASVVTPTGSTAYPVTMRLANPDGAVLLGMNGSVEIEIESIGDAVTVPIEAVLEDGGESYVYRIEDGRARRVDITTGRLTDTRAEVLSGLEDGDDVAVTALTDLTDGARVKVQ